MFTRGIDPKAAMKTGVITWEKLFPSCVIVAKQTVPIKSKNPEKFQFVIECDLPRAIFKKHGKNWSNIWTAQPNIEKNERLVIEEITYSKAHGTLMLDIKYRINGTSGLFNLTGPIERIKKYFTIINN